MLKRRRQLLILTGLVVVLLFTLAAWRSLKGGDRDTFPSAGPAAVTKALTADPVPLVKAYVIAVNGTDVVGLADRATAAGVVSDLKESYARTLSQDAVLEEVQISERIDIVERMIPVEKLRNADEAKRILLRGTDKLVYYTVQRGDTLWTIAQSRNMQVEDLQKANPEAVPEALQPGEQLNLVVADPYVNLQSKQKVTYIENIPYPVDEVADSSLYPWESFDEKNGIYGKKEVVIEIVRQNQQIVGRHLLSQRVLSEPVTAVYRRGTKLAPELGTGRLQLPLAGLLTSGYGWRGGEFHTGLDLAAPWGSPVQAADSGTVVVAGWEGDYGNRIIIDHGGGKLQTLYGHLSSFAVRVGDRVGKGQVIGRVGSTGRSTGPHVHFEVRVEGRHVNPMNYFPK